MSNVIEVDFNAIDNSVVSLQKRYKKLEPEQIRFLLMVVNDWLNLIPEGEAPELDICQERLIEAIGWLEKNIDSNKG